MPEKGRMNSRKTVMSLEEKWRLLIRETESGRGSSFSGRLWALPPLDIHSCAMDEIRKHLSVSSRLTGPDDIRIDLSRIRHQTRLTIIARDRPGLFSMITGVLAVNRLDIVSAKIFTWHDGTVVDTFHVLPPWSDYNDWQGMEDQLSDYLHSRSDLGERLSRIRDLKSSGPALNTAKASAVEIDNDTSDFFSIIDVKAPKRTTLVYDISRAISGLGWTSKGHFSPGTRTSSRPYSTWQTQTARRSPARMPGRGCWKKSGKPRPPRKSMLHRRGKTRYRGQ
jgi:[protein-PII] uridylyltransferase